MSHAFLGYFILSFSVLHLWLYGKIIGFIKKSFISTQYFGGYSVCQVVSSVMASSEAPHRNITISVEFATKKRKQVYQVNVWINVELQAVRGI